MLAVDEYNELFQMSHWHYGDDKASLSLRGHGKISEKMVYMRGTGGGRGGWLRVYTVGWWCGYAVCKRGRTRAFVHQLVVVLALSAWRMRK